jgi:hypothetical protein
MTTPPHATGGKVKIPLLGEVSKKTGATVALAVTGVGAILYWRYRKNAAASSAAAAAQSNAAAMQTDPAGNQCAQLDPTTGYCPGTMEDEQALEQASEGSDIGVGYDSGAGIAGTGLYTDPNGVTCVTPEADGYCPQSVTGTPTGSQITTNAQWVQEVDAANPAWTQAIAMVLGGVPVSAGQAQQYQEAVGIYGSPPQGAPSIQLTSTPQTTTPNQPTGGTSGSSGSGSGTSSGSSGGTGSTSNPVAMVTIPVTYHQRAETALSMIQGAGFTASTNPTRNPSLTYWSTGSSPEGGHQAPKGSHVTVNVAQHTY